ncbi:MAG: hypothetical protein U1D30_03375 [Planctomycetota bacterium]
MTFQEFEERLESWLSQAGETGTGSLTARLPAELRQKAIECPQSRQLLTDWIWLHEQMEALPKPVPSSGFAARVVAGIPSSTDWDDEDLDVVPHTQERSIFAVPLFVGSLVALAASVLVVLFLPTERPTQPPAVATRSTADQTYDLPGQLRDTGNAYLALARGMLDAVALTEDGRDRPEETVLAANTASQPPIHGALRSSTETLVGAGREISSTIRPITDSALGAFSFLLQSPARKSGVEKPSI